MNNNDAITRRQNFNTKLTSKTEKERCFTATGCYSILNILVENGTPPSFGNQTALCNNGVSAVVIAGKLVNSL
jgi:hypothetical protein